MTLAHVQTNFTQKYVGTELNFGPVLTITKIQVFILHLLALVEDGSRREWITHIAFLGKEASNLSFFAPSGQHRTAACSPGLVFSVLAYSQPYTNPLGFLVLAYSCVSAGDLPRSSAEYCAASTRNGGFSLF